jgi:hypothetical protein
MTRRTAQGLLGLWDFLDLAVGVAEFFNFRITTTPPHFISKFSAPARVILELAEDRS